MGVSYSKHQRQIAKDEGLYLITISARGMTFQGPVSMEEAELLSQYLVAMLERRYQGKPPLDLMQSADDVLAMARKMVEIDDKAKEDDGRTMHDP